MRLSMEEVQKQYKSTKKLYEQGLTVAPVDVKRVLDLFDTIEALQQENEQLKDENASLRNWNACEEKLHNELLESDKRRWELELELEDAIVEVEQLKEQVDTLSATVNMLAPDEIGKECSHIEALRKAREAIRAAWGDGSANAAMDKASKALTAIDKAIGGETERGKEG